MPTKAVAAAAAAFSCHFTCFVYLCKTFVLRTSFALVAAAVVAAAATIVCLFSVSLFALSTCLTCQNVACCVCIAAAVVSTVIAVVTAVAGGQSQLSFVSLNAANALANCTNFELINITLNLAKLGKVMA